MTLTSVWFFGIMSQEKLSDYKLADFLLIEVALFRKH